MLGIYVTEVELLVEGKEDFICEHIRRGEMEREREGWREARGERGMEREREGGGWREGGVERGRDGGRGMERGRDGEGEG